MRGLSTHCFQKDCRSSGHLKEQWRSRAVIKIDDTGASEKSISSPCMQLMFGWPQQLFGSSLQYTCQGEKACHHRTLPSKHAFLPVLLTWESLVHLGWFFSYVFWLYITSVSFLILFSLNPISICYYSKMLLSSLLLLLVTHFLVLLLFLFLHSASCSPVSVPLVLLQILYLIIIPFIPDLLTQSAFSYTMFSTIQCATRLVCCHPL